MNEFSEISVKGFFDINYRRDNLAISLEADIQAFRVTITSDLKTGSISEITRSLENVPTVIRTLINKFYVQVHRESFVVFDEAYSC